MEREHRKIDPEMLKNAKKLDKESLQLSKKLLDKVSGGGDVSEYESEYNCPRCGAPGLIIYLYGVRPFGEHCLYCHYDWMYEDYGWDEW